MNKDSHGVTKTPSNTKKNEYWIRKNLVKLCAFEPWWQENISKNSHHSKKHQEFGLLIRLGQKTYPYFNYFRGI